MNENTRYFARVTLHTYKKQKHSITSQKEQPKMNSSILVCVIMCSCIQICLADYDNLQDTCPAAPTSKQSIFINGLPCKDPNSITPSDFKSSKLSRPGDKNKFLRSATTIVTAADFPGLNTLGLSISRIDLDVDGLVLPLYHPRASELFFVSAGVVIAGFVDTKNQQFQKILKEGDVFVLPRGLLHFCLNAGDEAATIFSVLSSQNPGVVSVAGSLFESDPDMLNKLVRKIKSISSSQVNGLENATLFGFY
ncbi:germin-like protein subfamily 3 member 4 [Hevea brasiliensis]|nr:germin-like protein subfamily 3 member 4 [Hevea brasiliensis]